MQNFKPKNIILLSAFLLSSCVSNKEVYNLELTLRNKTVVTKQYELPDSIAFHIKYSKGTRFLTYKFTNKTNVKSHCLKRNVVSFKIQPTF